jgi:MoxR-like ATPase
MAAVDEVVVGKKHQVRLAFACLLADGHLLIEDRPGVGKTTLAQALARVLGLSFRRVQFTNDLLPADIIGVTVYNRSNESFDFHPGPVFAQVLLADEINRATPKTQSALLESMGEHQVTVDGETRSLPEPFFVIATQNPIDLAGTFPLPDSQLDRFLARVELGYPDPEAERELLKTKDRQHLLNSIKPRLTVEQFRELQQAVLKVTVSDALLDYLQALIQYSRDSQLFSSGLSPRAGLALQRFACAWALLNDRDHCLPEDVQAVFASVAGHRLRPIGGADTPKSELVDQILKDVPIP